MFRTGQKVVCIDAKGSPNLVKNEIYTVLRYWDDARGGAVLLKEVNPTLGYAFWPYRFREIDYNWVNEILIKLSLEVEDSELVRS